MKARVRFANVELLLPAQEEEYFVREIINLRKIFLGINE